MIFSKVKVYDNIYKKRFLYFNLYVIKGVDGDILIDTGFIINRKKLKKWLDNFNVKLIILTHAHVDHIWNSNYIKKIYNCDIAIGKLDLENIDNTKIKSQPSKKNHKYWTKLMNYGMNKFIPEKFNVDYLLEDNQIINKYGLDLKIVSLPGHTNGSIGIKYNDYLFVGDAMVYRKKYPEIAYQNQDNIKAIESFNKVFSYNPKIIFIGHDKEIIVDKLNNK